MRFLYVLFFLCIAIPQFVFATSPYIFCIEGGGSKTTLHVVRKNGDSATLCQNGQPFDQIETSSSNINSIGEEGVSAVFQQLVNTISIDGVSIKSIAEDCIIVAGMAGASVQTNKDKIYNIFEGLGFKREHIILMTDVELCLALVESKGMVLISGTGSICFGKNGHSIYRVGGLGRVLGDEGSGYYIGLNALKLALADEYGWGSSTTLTSAFKDYFSVFELKELIPAINQLRLSSSEIAAVTPIVFKHAQEGDFVAKKVIDMWLDSLTDLIKKQIAISDLKGGELHLYGGLFAHENNEQFIQKIMKNIPCLSTHFKVKNLSSSYPALEYAKRFIIKKEPEV